MAASALGTRSIALAVVGLVAGGCYPAAVTREGRSIGALYDFVFVLSLIVVAIVWGLLTVAILRYRRRGRADGGAELPPQIGGHTGLEAVWTGIPLLTVGVIFALTLAVLGEVERPPSSDRVELHVEAFRWGWRISYPAEAVSVEGFLDPGPQAVVPVGRPLLITLTSADVVHAFYVPQFLYKRDAVPGRPQSFEVTVEQAGIYGGQCAEFCGLFHARMPFSIRAVPTAEYEAWLLAQRAPRP